MYTALANLVVVAHLTLTLCVVTGIVLAITGVLRRHRRLERIFYVMAFAVLTSQLLYGECIMTVWEKALRNLADPGSAYRRSFLGHYFPWIPPLVFDWIGPGLLILSLLEFPAWRMKDARQRRELQKPASP